jgi:hypothetical protein
MRNTVIYAGLDNIIISIIFGIILHIIVPKIAVLFATYEEIYAPNGYDSLSLKGKFMHKFVVTSNIDIVNIIINSILIGVAIYLGFKLEPSRELLKLSKL